jgi:DedD protein
MADRIAENTDLAVDELRRKARRRLVGAIVLALAAAIILPLLLEKEPKPLGDEVSVQIPPVDEGRFVNRLTGAKAKDAKAERKPGSVDPTPAKGVAKPEAEPAPAVAAAAPPPAAAPEPSPTQPLPIGTTPAGKSLAEAEQRVLMPAPKPAPKTAAAPARSAPPAAKTEPKAEPKADAAPAAAAKAAPKADAPPPPAAAAPSAPSAPAPAAPAPTAAKSDAGPEPQPAAAAAPIADGFVVQLAAFTDDKGANALAARLKKAGYAAYTEPVQTSRGTLYRVRVGGYATRDAAVAAREQLKGEGHSGIVASANK